MQKKKPSEEEKAAHEKAASDFQRRFSEFMAAEGELKGGVEQFVLFYMQEGRGGGIIQSFEEITVGFAYALHIMSNVLRADGDTTHHHKAFIIKNGELVSEIPLDKDEVDSENKPN